MHREVEPVIRVPIADASQIAEARRRFAQFAERLGFDATGVGQVALAASELASNVFRHGRGGEMLGQALRDGSGLEVLALDKGPGMHSVEACLRDGYSTGGTAGTGLGAIQRQSAELQIYSRLSGGTAVLCRFKRKAVMRTAVGSASPPTEAFSVGGVAVPVAGYEACGDAWNVVLGESEATVLLADGLGHGAPAASAANEAMRLFAHAPDRPVVELLAVLHEGLRATRGAAVAVARMSLSRRVLCFGGVGNIAGTLLSREAARKLVSHNGTAGHAMRRAQAFDYPLGTDSVLILHSDGVSASWSLDRYPGLVAFDPVLIAGVLFRDFSRARDDASVVVVKERSS